MAAPLVTSDGFACGPVQVPSFCLDRGECLQIVAPNYATSLAVGAALTAPTAGLRIAGRIHFSQSAWDERGRLAQLVWPAPTAAGWIARAAGIPVREATALLAEFGFDLDPRTRISHLPGNYRALIGLTAAWATRPDVLVFTADGIDWTGRQWLAQQIKSRLGQWAAIELSCPHFSRGQYQVGPAILPNAVSITAAARAFGISA